MAGQAAHCRIWHFFQIKRRAPPGRAERVPRCGPRRLVLGRHLRQEPLSRNATGLQVRRPIKPPTAGGTEREQCVRDLIRRFVNGRNGSVPILPKERDPRLITIRRGGTLTDEHHRLLADWALLCAEHVLHLFEDHQPGDSRPGDAIDVGRAWIRGEVRMGDAHRAAFQANAAARGMPDPASSLHCRRARRLRWLTSPPMTWALRRTPSGRPAHASQPTTLRKLGPRSGSGSGCTSLPLSVNSFSTINNAGAPSLLGCGPGSLASLSSDLDAAMSAAHQGLRHRPSNETPPAGAR